MIILSDHKHSLILNVLKQKYSFVDKDGNGIIQLDTTNEKLNELTGSYHYYPFGMMWEGGHYRKDPVNPPPSQGNFFAPQNVKNKYRYNGKEFIEDYDIGLYCYGARYYDPKVGRFMSVDPLAKKFAAWSPYTYTMNNPIRYVDPTGMSTEDADWIPDKNTGNLIAEVGDNAKTLSENWGYSKREDQSYIDKSKVELDSKGNVKKG